MERYYKYFLSITVCLFGLSVTSCQNGADIGDLYGQWRLDEAIDADGVSFLKDGMYLSFQDKVACVKQVNYTSHGYQDVFASFLQEGDSLFFHFSSNNHAADDTAMVCRTFRFEPFTNARVHVVKSDAKHLILDKQGICWKFSKY